VLGDGVLNVDRQVHARAHTYLYAVSFETVLLCLLLDLVVV
jgi:hypothetical protein